MHMRAWQELWYVCVLGMLFSVTGAMHAEAWLTPWDSESHAGQWVLEDLYSVSSVVFDPAD